MKKENIAAALQNAVEEITRKIEGISEEDFSKMPAPEKWSIAQQVVHLFEVARSIAGGIGSPEILEKYGRAEQPSRDFDNMKDAYEKRILQPLPPPFDKFRHINTEGGRSEILQNFHAIHAKLTEKMARFTEEDLDIYQLPHPVIGLMTLREMLYFTVFHLQHHQVSIEKLCTTYV